MLCVNPYTNFKPEDDYYNYVNEAWLKNTEIPSDKAKYGTFNILHDKTEVYVKELVEQAINSTDENFKKLGILYHQGLKNTNKTYDKEFEQIRIFYNMIQSNNNFYELMTQVTNTMCRISISSPFDMYVSSDYDDPKTNILYLTSSGLGLPDRDYYMVDNEKNTLIREQYKEFLKIYCSLFKYDFDFDRLYELERRLAEKTYTKAEKRNIEKTNNPMHWNEFEKKYPNLSFIKYVFTKTDNNPGKINISNPSYFELLNNLITEDLDLWKNYFNMKFVLDASSYLSEEIYTLYFNFYGKIIKGLKEKEPTWKRSIKLCEELVGELIGKLYTDNYFPKSTKEKAYELITFIQEQLSVILKNNTWMEETTKQKSIEKLNKMNVKIGYPEQLERDYDFLEVKEEYTYFENILFSKVFLIDDHLSYLYEPVDRKKWYMNAHNVNAYYSPNMNDIVFPAGILQEPFFSADQDASYNFGGIGSVIGHEITHGFDDEGRRFNGDGLLEDWWSKNDVVEYKKRTQIIVEQYSKYSPLNNEKKVNGLLTLGENIADIGGVYIAYHAYMKYLEKYPNENKTINNFTPEQRFFMNYANIWKNKSRIENTELMLVIDPHSPAIFRVNGVMKNLDEFYKAYNVKEGDNMFIPKTDRAKIWSL
jgi:predicted metalloendopeptidase